MGLDSDNSEESHDEREVTEDTDAQGQDAESKVADELQNAAAVTTPDQGPEDEDEDDDDEDDEEPTSEKGQSSSPSPEEHRRRSSPRYRPETVTATVYDIVPTIAAPHSTSINAITATPDLRWVFSGGSDGYIRRFNWIDTANGKSMLTVAQRHPFVDSVVKAGMLVSYWENSDEAGDKPTDDSSQISSVYSLATQRDALWILSGTESGSINLQSVRYDEGKRITTLKGHNSAVSVLNLAADEKSVLSGGWDKIILEWDLNTGKTMRNYAGSSGQISAIESRPTSSLPVPQTADIKVESSTMSSDNASAPRDGSGGASVDQQNTGAVNGDVNGTVTSPPDSLFGGGDADSLFGDNEAMADPASAAFGTNDDDDGTATANAFSNALAGDLPEDAMQDAENEDDVEFPAPTTELPSSLTNGQSSKPSSPSRLETSILDVDAMDTSKVEEGDTATQPALPVSDEALPTSTQDAPSPDTTAPSSDTTFLAASIDGSIRIWDKRRPNPLAKMFPHGVPPWCMNACWSPDGNSIYAGRRNGSIDEYDLRTGLAKPSRNFKLPANSGAVSALRAMPNGRHLLCASYDILRLYDLQEQQIFKHATVPFLIVPGHRTSVVSQLYLDPTCRYLISTAGNRGWEGSTSEVLLGYEVIVPKSGRSS